MIALSASLLLPHWLNASAATTTVSILTSSGTIIQTTNLNKAIIVYGRSTLNNIEISFIKNNFKLLICDFIMSPSVLASLKVNNPNLLILGYCDSIGVGTGNSYWSTVNANENWFMHDIKGNRVSFFNGMYYLMDPGSSGWRQFYSSHINSQLNGTLFDGVFADDVWNQLSDFISWGCLNDGSTNEILTNTDMPSSSISNWHGNMIGFLQYVEGHIISGKKVIVNTNEYLTNDYLNVVEGKMHEGGIHPNWYNLQTYAPLRDVLDTINGLARDSATGKIFIAENGVAAPASLDSSTLAEITKNANYCYAATLLGSNSANCYSGYDVGPNYTFDSQAYYSPTFVTNLGLPTNSFYQNQSVYMRDFTNGKVLFNPSNNSYQITLGNNYYLTNGTMVSSIVLGAWSGQILTSSL
jgi:hypothetical protein